MSNLSKEPGPVHAVVTTNSTGSRCLMLTDRRLLLAHERLLGPVTYQYYKISDVTVLKIEQGLTGSVLIYEVFGRRTRVRLGGHGETRTMESALRFLGRD